MQMIPFDKRDGFIWINGYFEKWSEAKVHVLNHGLHYGSCVFEGIRIYKEKFLSLMNIFIDYSNLQMFSTYKYLLISKKFVFMFVR